MLMQDVIRAWKNEEFRLDLSDVERSLLPAHPAGLLDLTDADLDSASGGLPPNNSYETYCSLGWRCISTSWSCG